MVTGVFLSRAFISSRIGFSVPRARRFSSNVRYELTLSRFPLFNFYARKRSCEYAPGETRTPEIDLNRHADHPPSHRERRERMKCTPHRLRCAWGRKNLKYREDKYLGDFVFFSVQELGEGAQLERPVWISLGPGDTLKTKVRGRFTA